MSGAWVYVVSLFLLFGNAFFVGAEFAAMAVRRSAPGAARRRRSKRAGTSIEALERLGSMLATAQLGITVCLWDSVPGRGRPPPPVRAGLRGVGMGAAWAEAWRSQSPCSSCPTCTSWSGR